MAATAAIAAAVLSRSSSSKGAKKPDGKQQGVQAVSRHLTPLLQDGEAVPDDHLQLIRSKMKIKRICEVQRYNNNRWLDRTLVLTKAYLFILWKRNNKEPEIVESIPLKDIFFATKWPEENEVEDVRKAPTLERGEHMPSRYNLMAQKESTVSRKPPLPSPDRGDHFVFKVRSNVRPEKTTETKRYFKFVRELPAAHIEDTRLSRQKSLRNEKKYKSNMTGLLNHMNKRGKKERQRYKILNRWSNFQRSFRDNALETLWFNFILFSLIVANFGVTVMDLQNDDPDQASLYQTVDVFFNIIFLIELLLNVLAYGKANLNDSWFWFDVVVVGTSIVLLFADAGGSNSIVKQMRILRAFRLLRVVGRFGNLRRIVNSLVNSLIPTFQAQMIALIVVFIYSVIGLQYFGERSEDSFGTFSRACLTLFGLISGVSAWPADLPLLDDDYNLDLGVVCYSFSYIMLVLMILLQMVVAVLIDCFFAEKAKELEDSIRERDFEDPHGERALDPFLKHITTEFQTQAGLDELLQRLFKEFDFNESGGLTYTELCNALSQYGVDLTAHELDSVSETVLNQDSGMDLLHFRRWMSVELKAYMQRQASEALTEETSHEISAVLQGMRTLMVEQADIRREQATIQARQNYLADTTEQTLAAINRIATSFGVPAAVAPPFPSPADAPYGKLNNPKFGANGYHHANGNGGRAHDRESDGLPVPLLLESPGNGQMELDSTASTEPAAAEQRVGDANGGGGRGDGDRTQQVSEDFLLGWAGHGVASHFVFVDEAVERLTGMTTRTSLIPPVDKRNGMHNANTRDTVTSVQSLYNHSPRPFYYQGP